MRWSLLFMTGWSINLFPSVTRTNDERNWSYSDLQIVHQTCILGCTHIRTPHRKDYRMQRYNERAIPQHMVSHTNTKSFAFQLGNEPVITIGVTSTVKIIKGALIRVFNIIQFSYWKSRSWTFNAQKPLTSARPAQPLKTFCHFVCSSTLASINEISLCPTEISPT
jgi:hypothetical protein